MSIKGILLTPTAQLDLQNAYAYLNEQRHGLGDVFLDEFRRVSDLLLTFPELYPKLRGHIRRGVIRKFRYIFTYIIQGDVIVIARIVHSRENTEQY